jgi:hypothetical protein
LRSTRAVLDQSIPTRQLDRNLLIATWNLRAFGDLTDKWAAGRRAGRGRRCGLVAPVGRTSGSSRRPGVHPDAQVRAVADGRGSPDLHPDELILRVDCWACRDLGVGISSVPRTVRAARFRLLSNVPRRCSPRRSSHRWSSCVVRRRPAGRWSHRGRRAPSGSD